MSLRSISAGLAALLTPFLLAPALAQTPKPLRIGVLNDMAGIYADMAGPGSVIAAQMAVEDSQQRPSAFSPAASHSATWRDFPVNE